MEVFDSNPRKMKVWFVDFRIKGNAFQKISNTTIGSNAQKQIAGEGTATVSFS